MSILSLATLLFKETKAAIYQKALDIAVTLGLPVTSWQAGDPTRSLYHLVAEELEAQEDGVSHYIASGFLEHATGGWLKIVAKQHFNVTAVDATFASTPILLSNGGGGEFTYDPGDLTVKNTATGKTYTNTSGGTLARGPGTTLILDVTADEAGSDSNAGIGDIDDLVTTSLGVTVTNTAAAVGADAESEDSIKNRCRLKLASLSPNGPADAYEYVALQVPGVTRARTYPESNTGDVLLYVAGPGGAVAGAVRDAVEAAVLGVTDPATAATPLCITPTVLSASNVSVAVTYQLWLYASVGKTEAEVEAAVVEALTAMFAGRPIGGDIKSPALTGKLHKRLIESTIRGVFPAQAFDIFITSPAGDTSLTNGQVATLGAISHDVIFEVDP